MTSAPNLDAFNLAAHVLAAGLTAPDKPALEILGPDQSEVWSYARLTRAVLGCGGWLLAQGLSAGDRVLIRMGNQAGYPILYLGAMAAGLVPVATSAALTEIEITRMSAHVAPRLVIADPQIAVPQGYKTLAADLNLWQDHPPCDFHLGPAEREAYLVFTSGTSGTPLAVRHAHRAILARCFMHEGWEGLTPEDRLLHSGAFNWTYTMGTGLLDPWTLGATALIPAPEVPLELLPLLLRRHGATIFASVPTIFRRLLRGTLPPFPHLRHALSAGEALPPDLREAWQARTGTDIHEALGMSEVSTFLSGSPARPAPRGSSGFAQTGREIAVLGPGGEVLPHGEIGSLAISTRDQGLMLSYLGHPAPAGDWFQSGDLVHQDASGAIYYHGRRDDMLNPGGIRVSPREVELALASIDGIGDLAVGEVVTTTGAKIIACFYTGAGLDIDAANEFAARQLAGYKCPRIWVHVAVIPRGPTGKVLRRQLAAPPHEAKA